MKTLIVYASQHGCAETCAGKIRDGLNGETDLVNIKENPAPDLDAADAVIIGGSIHAGRVQKKIRKFCEANLDALLKKKIGLFLCCMEDGEKARQQFDAAYPEELREHASAVSLPGGAFNFENMNFVEKSIIRKVSGVTENVSRISDEAIADFVSAMNG